jgi:hypothetical protein
LIDLFIGTHTMKTKNNMTHCSLYRQKIDIYTNCHNKLQKHKLSETVRYGLDKKRTSFRKIAT